MTSHEIGEFKDRHPSIESSEIVVIEGHRDELLAINFLASKNSFDYLSAVQARFGINFELLKSLAENAIAGKRTQAIDIYLHLLDEPGIYSKYHKPTNTDTQRALDFAPMAANIFGKILFSPLKALACMNIAVQRATSEHPLNPRTILARAMKEEEPKIIDLVSGDYVPQDIADELSMEMASSAHAELQEDEDNQIDTDDVYRTLAVTEDLIFALRFFNSKDDFPTQLVAAMLWSNAVHQLYDRYRSASVRQKSRISFGTSGPRIIQPSRDRMADDFWKEFKRINLNGLAMPARAIVESVYALEESSSTGNIVDLFVDKPPFNGLVSDRRYGD